MQKPKENILSSGSNSLLGWLQLITSSLSEFSWLLKRAQKIKKKKRNTIYTTSSQHNWCHPQFAAKRGSRNWKPRFFWLQNLCSLSHARLCCAQEADGTTVHGWIYSWSCANGLHPHFLSQWCDQRNTVWLSIFWRTKGEEEESVYSSLPSSRTQQAGLILGSMNLGKYSPYLSSLWSKGRARVGR